MIIIFKSWLTRKLHKEAHTGLILVQTMILDMMRFNSIEMYMTIYDFIEWSYGRKNMNNLVEVICCLGELVDSTGGFIRFCVV